MSKQACLVHVVGSMPLGSVEEVMSTTAAILGPRVRRMTNGEVGRTQGWIVGHHRIFARHPAFEEYVHEEKFDPRAPNIKRRRFRLKEGQARQRQRRSKVLATPRMRGTPSRFYGP